MTFREFFLSVRLALFFSLTVVGFSALILSLSLFVLSSSENKTVFNCGISFLSLLPFPVTFFSLLLHFKKYICLSVCLSDSLNSFQPMGLVERLHQSDV